MAEEKKVITIDGVEYKDGELSDEAKGCLMHLNSLDQKIASAQFNLNQLQVGRRAFAELLTMALKDDMDDAEDVAAE